MPGPDPLTPHHAVRQGAAVPGAHTSATGVAAGQGGHADAVSERDAVLLDVDGTLVDSTYFHVAAWVQAFRETGHASVPAARLHRMIGAGSGVLVRGLLDEPSDDEVAAVTDAHSRAYGERLQHLQPLDGAVELVRALTDRGLAVALASSASGDEKEVLEGVLEDAAGSWEAFTSSADAEAGKPDPSVLLAALEALDVPPARAVTVGDATWDAAASARIGVPTVGVLSGGIAATELRDAGCVATYAGARALLEGLDDAPVARLFRRR